MIEHTKLNAYIVSVDADFKILSYRPILQEEFIINECVDILDDDIPGMLFDNFSMKRKLDHAELRIYVDKIKKVRKGKVKLYLEPGLPRKIRLSYDTNTFKKWGY